ncbi:MAG: hypothetical protein NC548_50095, partial [Lachnospiraceae bacterium]|nr:hypothetical protein [Lachnospiraceae bacterium]
YAYNVSNSYLCREVITFDGKSIIYNEEAGQRKHKEIAPRAQPTQAAVQGRRAVIHLPRPKGHRPMVQTLSSTALTPSPSDEPLSLAVAKGTKTTDSRNIPRVRVRDIRPNGLRL